MQSRLTCPKVVDSLHPGLFAHPHQFHIICIGSILAFELSRVQAPVIMYFFDYRHRIPSRDIYSRSTEFQIVENKGFFQNADLDRV